MKLKNKSLFLAPMAGFCDSAFRILCKKNGADIVMTEMISAAALARNNKATINLIDYKEEENPIGIQLFGQNEINFLKSIEKIESKEFGNFDFIDINLGCPATKIIKQGSGFALSRRKNKMFDLVKSCVENSKLPITAKIRIGEDEKLKFGIEQAQLLEKVGVMWISVHGRTFKQGYSGNADWDYIKKIKKSVSIPVIGNGDIDSPEFAKKYENDFEGLMLGRAILSNPYLFQQIKDYRKSGKYVEFDLEKRKKIVEEYIKIAEKCNSPPNNVKNHLIQLTKSFSGATKLRDEVAKEKDIESIKKIILKKI